MSEPGKKRWLIKDREGRVRGPYYTDDILARISRGEFSGEEFIALYPSTEWLPISNDPQFYDHLLSFLEGERASMEDAEVAPMESIDIEDRPEEFVEKPTSKGKVEHVSHKQKESEESSVPPRGSDDNYERGRVERKKKWKDPAADAVIELKKIKKVVKKAKAKKASVPMLIGTIVVMAAAYYLFVPTTGTGNQIHLQPPQNGRPALSDAQAKPKIERAIVEYVKDDYPNYLNAQAELVQVVEGQPKNMGVLALLCLTYLELWPYAHQDSGDLTSISIVTQMASRVDPAGIETATCRVVDLMVRGRFLEAKGITETVLDSHGGGAKPPIAFYYFKARLSEAAKDYAGAITYSQSAQQLWPQWLRVYSLDASANVSSGKFSEAANKYRAILKANPQHQVAQIELGVIEYQHLKNIQRGQQLLQAAMGRNPRVPREIASRGNLGLAEIYLQQGDRSSGLKYAQRAYALNPANNRAKDIIVSIGGEAKLRETKIVDAQLVYEGDQLVREGDCRAAQAHYKAAFERNNKNALAAYKAAECLWSLSLTTEAIDWLNKSIRADAAFVDAYVLLADYFTQRFNYLSAGQILAKARSQAPNSYKVYRGYALVEFRRNSMASAANYAQKAIQLYEADVESYVILSRALMGQRDYPKAFEAASKATEIEANHRQAQIAYADALAATKGLPMGIDYLNRLVTTYPTITDYRLALGQMYVKDQSYTSAETIFRQVVDIEEKPKRAYIELGKALQMQRRYDDAVSAFFQAAQIDPADMEALFLSGLVYLEAKKPSEARQQFQRVMRINKDYPLLNYYIGKAALQMDSPNEALEQAIIEKGKNPNMADPYMLAAEAYTELKQYSQCAGEYQQAVRLRPQGADIYIKMARCYRMSGNLDAAVSMINQASYQESGNPEVWKEQGAIYEMRQESIKAIEAYSQYLVLAPNAPDREQVQMRINALSR